VASVSGAATSTSAPTADSSPNRIRPDAARYRPSGTKPLLARTTQLTSTMATRLATNSSTAPPARSSRPIARVNPTVDSGGTSATATATPGSAADTSSRAVA
jgi:hypothetical protein